MSESTLDTVERADPAEPTFEPATIPARRRMLRLGDRTDSRENNFDLLRLFAAWGVLVSHSFALTGRAEPLHQFGTTLGNVSVLVFFAISGLLIHRSWSYDPTPRRFWSKRALRLFPGLLVVSMLTAFVLGPVVTSVPLGTYATSLETWIYPVRVTLLAPFGAQLPGVFDGNEFPSAVNGPLWSLPVEVAAYAMLATAGVLGLLRHPRIVLAIALMAVVWAHFWSNAVGDTLAQLGVLAGFAVGSAAYTFRSRIPLDWRLALLVAGVAAATADTSLRGAVWTVAIAYLTFWFAYALPPLGRWLTRHGDASYGVYIYAWPMQQTIVWACNDSIGPWILIGVATPVVWLLAQASWHLVEHPALRRKPRARAAAPAS